MIYKSPHSVICILSNVQTFAIKFLYFEVRYVSQISYMDEVRFLVVYAIVKCLVKLQKVKKGHETVNVAFLCPVPGWSEEEEAKLQQRGSVRGGVGGQR